MQQLRLTFVLLAISMPAAAIAEVVKYEFAGTISGPIGTLPVGSAFQGSFTYDTTNPEIQGIGDPNFGLYKLNDFEVFFGSEFIRINCCTIKIDNRSTFDQIATQSLSSVGVVEGGLLGGIDFSTAGQFDLTVADLTGTALSSDALPGTELTLSAFALSPRLTFFRSDTGLFVSAVLTALNAAARLPDTDGDGLPDYDPDNPALEDKDDDNDGVPDQEDDDPNDPFFCEDRDGDTCNDCSIQVDGFGPLNDFDTFNDGPDADGDGICDAGDTNLDDADGDGIEDLLDNCPSIANSDQADSNQDSFGDACVPTDTVIGNNVSIGSNPTIGLGTTIRRGTTIGDNVTLGTSVVIAKDSTLGDNVSVGDQTKVKKGAKIGSNVSLGTNVTVGKNVQVAIDVQIGDGTLIRKNVVIGTGTSIGENVLIRQGAAILPGSVVPDGTVVGKNSTFPST
jgi:acetyltransferase-like isoleucine patch superfamily enzyme